MTTLSDSQVIALWLYEGGSLSSAPEALARALAESSGSATVTSGNPDGGTNVGVWQLDTKGVGSGYTVAQLQDPYVNAMITVQATGNGQNWGPWADNWGSYIGQAQQSVTLYEQSAGRGSKATGYMNSLLQGVPGHRVTGKTKIQNGPGALPSPSGSASGGQAQSLSGQSSSVVSQAADLLHGTAESLNWFWQFFQPGQGWRIAFGAGAVVLGYMGLRTWGLVPSVKGAL